MIAGFFLYIEELANQVNNLRDTAAGQTGSLPKEKTWNAESI